jgi:hypothetical protein
MANAFMPSAFASMNAAGQGTLEQIMKQRLFEQELLKSQIGMQRQVNADAELSRRYDAQERYQQGMVNAREQAIAAQLQIAQEKAAQAQAAAAAKDRASRNVAGAADMFFEGLTRGEDPNSPAMLRVATEGKVPAAARPKKEETPAERRQRIYDDAMARREADAAADKRFQKPTKPTKVGKDTPGAPAAFRAVIQNRIGSAGFDNAANAVKSIEAKWPEWRKSYPGLDLNAVRTAIQNIYGQRVSGGGSDFIASAIADALKQNGLNTPDDE